MSDLDRLESSKGRGYTSKTHSTDKSETKKLTGQEETILPIKTVNFSERSVKKKVSSWKDVSDHDSFWEFFNLKGNDYFKEDNVEKAITSIKTRLNTKQKIEMDSTFTKILCYTLIALFTLLTAFVIFIPLHIHRAIKKRKETKLIAGSIFASTLRTSFANIDFKDKNSWQQLAKIFDDSIKNISKDDMKDIAIEKGIEKGFDLKNIKNETLDEALIRIVQGKFTNFMNSLPEDEANNHLKKYFFDSQGNLNESVQGHIRKAAGYAKEKADALNTAYNKLNQR